MYLINRIGFNTHRNLLFVADFNKKVSYQLSAFVFVLGRNFTTKKYKDMIQK